MENDTVKLENGLKMGQRKHLWYESGASFQKESHISPDKKMHFHLGIKLFICFM